MDEDVFQRARRIVIASIQNVIMYEYLPALMGSGMPEYSGYNPDTHPGVSHMFQAAAFRFGHTMIPPGIYRRDGKCNYRTTAMGYPAMRLCSTWWDSNVRGLVMQCNGISIMNHIPLFFSHNTRPFWRKPPLRKSSWA